MFTTVEYNFWKIVIMLHPHHTKWLSFYLLFYVTALHNKSLNFILSNLNSKNNKEDFFFSRQILNKIVKSLYTCYSLKLKVVSDSKYWLGRSLINIHKESNTRVGTFFSQRHFCMASILNEGSILHKDKDKDTKLNFL